MAAGIRLTHKEASDRFESSGFELRSVYFNQKTKVTAFCKKHKCEHTVFPMNVFKGQGLKCCMRESVRERRTNHEMSELTKEKLRQFKGEAHHGFGKELPQAVRIKVSNSLKRAASLSVDYAINKARSGKTAGKRGVFYIADVGNGIFKIGSIVKMTVQRRMNLLYEDYGTAKILLLVNVDDAGDYEASMMDALRKYWVKGERFRDFRAAVC